MTGSEKIGRGSSQEPAGPGRKQKVGDGTFKEMMKVGKVRETDPDEKKKRKHPQEAKEEVESLQKAPGQKSKEKTPDKSPLLGQVSGSQIREEPTRSPDDNVPPVEEPPPFFSLPFQEGTKVERNGVESRKTKQPKSSKTEPKKAKTVQRPKKKVAKKVVAGAYIPPKQGEITHPEKKLKKEDIPSGPPPIAEPKEKVKKAEKKAPPLAKGAWEVTTDATKKKEKISKPEKEGVKIPETAPAPAPVTPTEKMAPAAPVEQMAPVSAAFSRLPPHIQAVFERMVGTMTVMHASEIKKTTIELTSDAMKTSPFYGSSVVITEYSTAPKQFNIEIIGNRRATDLIKDHTNELAAAFQAGNYNFKVHRIDTSYQTSAAAAKKAAKTVKRKKKGG